MVTSALISGKQPDNKSVSNEPCSNQNDLSCRKRKASVVAELDNKKLRKISCDNVSRHNTGDPRKVSEEFGRDSTARNDSSAKRAPKKRQRSPSIIVVDGSESEKGIAQERKASANAEPLVKKQRASEPECGTSRSFSDQHASKYNESVSNESRSNLNDLSCRKRKAIVVAELDNMKLRKISCDNVSRHNTGDPRKVSVEFGRDSTARKESSAKRAPKKRPRSPSIIVVDGSESEEGIAQEKKASANAEPPVKKQRDSEPECGTSRSFSDQHASKWDFERKYKQLGFLGKGGFGSVFAGLRLEDSLPVAIKYTDVQRELNDGGVPLEVVLMQKAGGRPESVGKYGSVTLLDWYHMDEKLVIVMERPPTSMDLQQYISCRGGTLQEKEAKAFMNQLVYIAIDMHDKGVFHRDLKLENTLVEIGSPVPRLRIIDFGCGSYKQEKISNYFRGTVPYAPPEWFNYAEYEPVPTTVWQLGAMLYSMLHTEDFDTRLFTIGDIPFDGNLSYDCLEFFCLCFEENSEDRATLGDLWAHPWLN